MLEPHARRYALAAAITFLTLSACAAPDPETDTALRLVEAMAAVGPPDSVDVVSGAVPQGAALPDLPEGDRVVGSVAGPAGTRVFLASALPLDSVGPVYGRRLTAEGWRYASAPGGPRASAWIQERLCRDGGERLDLVYGGRADGAVDIELHVSPAESEPCPADLDASMGQTSLPRLLPPEGVEVGGACRSGEQWAGRARPQLAAGGQPMDHYRSWMEATAWSPADDATPSVARSWTRVDERDRPNRVTLAVTGGAGSPECRTLTFSAGLRR